MVGIINRDYGHAPFGHLGRRVHTPEALGPVTVTVPTQTDPGASERWRALRRRCEDQSADPCNLKGFCRGTRMDSAPK